MPQTPDFNPRVPGVPGDGSPVILHIDESRGLTYTWHDLSRRKQDWQCRESGYLVSRLTITDTTLTEVGALGVTHTTSELVAAEMPTSFHWADENIGACFGYRFGVVTDQQAWAAAYNALRTLPPSSNGKDLWVLGASDAPDEPKVLAAELDAARQALDIKVAAFVEFLSVPFVDYAHLDRTYTTPDGECAPLRGTGVAPVMYRLAAQRLATQGKVLRASGLQSTQAAALWKRLAADPTTPTHEVTVRYWSTNDQLTYLCLDYTGEFTDSCPDTLERTR